MAYDTTNIFAKILRGEVPCKKIAENDYFIAFYDISPKTPIHALVIPKGAYANSYDFHNNASSDEIVGFYKGIVDVVDILKINEGGYRSISNSGLNGGQEVPHYHVHLLAGRPLGPLVTA